MLSVCLSVSPLGNGFFLPLRRRSRRDKDLLLLYFCLTLNSTKNTIQYNTEYNTIQSTLWFIRFCTNNREKVQLCLVIIKHCHHSFFQLTKQSPLVVQRYTAFRNLRNILKSKDNESDAIIFSIYALFFFFFFFTKLKTVKLKT